MTRGDGHREGMGSILVRPRSVAGGNESWWACPKVVQWGDRLGLDSGSDTGAPGAGGRWRAGSVRTKNPDKLSVGKPCARFTVGSQVEKMELIADLEGVQLLLLFKAASAGRSSRIVGLSTDSGKPIGY